MKYLLQNIVQGKKFVAVTHLETNTGEYYQMITAVVDKGELSIKETSEFNDFELLVSNIPKNVQVHLIFDNQQILQNNSVRKLDDTHEIAREAFPNINLEQFYYEVSQTAEFSCVAIVRRKYIDDIVVKYSEEKIHITGWSLGPYGLSFLLPYLDSNIQLEIPNYKINRQGEIINAYDKVLEYSTTVYWIEGMEVESNFLLSLSGVLGCFLRLDRGTLTNNAEGFKKIKKEFLLDRSFRLGLPTAIGILFVIFLVNFLVHESYFNNVSVLEESTQISGLQSQLLVQKDSLVSSKEKRFNDIAMAASSSSSFYIDKMIEIMPLEILLQNLKYQPLIKKIRPGKPIAFDNDMIVVRGETNKNRALTQWITLLEELAFVEKSTISIEHRNSMIQFEIHIRLIQ